MKRRNDIERDCTNMDFNNVLLEVSKNDLIEIKKSFKVRLMEMIKIKDFVEQIELYGSTEYVGISKAKNDTIINNINSYISTIESILKEIE